MAHERAQTRASRHVPQLDALVCRAAGQHSLGEHTQCVDIGRVAGQSRFTSVVCVTARAPYLDAHVVRAAGESVAVETFHTVDVARVSAECVATRAREHVPHAHAGVPRGARQLVRVGEKLERRDHMLVSGECAHTLVRSAEIPQLDGAIGRAAGQHVGRDATQARDGQSVADEELLIGRNVRMEERADANGGVERAGAGERVAIGELDGEDVRAVAVEGAKQTRQICAGGGGGRIAPDFDGAVVRAAHQLFAHVSAGATWRERECVHVAAVTVKSAQAFPCQRIPQPDGGVARTARDQRVAERCLDTRRCRCCCCCCGCCGCG